MRNDNLVSEYIATKIAEYLNYGDSKIAKNLSRRWYYSCAPKFMYPINGDTVPLLENYPSDLRQVQTGCKYTVPNPLPVSLPGLRLLESTGSRIKILDLTIKFHEVIDFSKFPFLESLELQLCAEDPLHEYVTTDLSELHYLKNLEVRYSWLYNHDNARIVLPVSVVDLDIETDSCVFVEIVAGPNISGSEIHHSDEIDLKPFENLRKLDMYFHKDSRDIELQVPKSLEVVNIPSSINICNPDRIQKLKIYLFAFGRDCGIFVQDFSKIRFRESWNHLEHLSLSFFSNSFSDEETVNVLSLDGMRSLQILCINNMEDEHAILIPLSEYGQLTFECACIFMESFRNLMENVSSQVSEVRVGETTTFRRIGENLSASLNELVLILGEEEYGCITMSIEGPYIVLKYIYIDGDEGCW